MEKLNKFIENSMFIIFLLFIIIFIVPFFQSRESGNNYNYEEINIEEEKQEEEIITVTATVYNAVQEQCDSTPLITADGSFIDTTLLNKGEVKWIAVSRDLIGTFKFGDKVWIDYLQDTYEIHDLMAKRYTNHIDILVPENIKYGKFETTIRKEEN